MKYNLTLLLLTFSVLLFVTGCGGNKQPAGVLEGKITCKGKPLTCGIISLYSAASGQGGGANIQADGTYKTKDVYLGEYQVMIIPPEPEGPSSPVTDEIKNFPVPNKFRAFETSGLTVTVEKGTKTFNLDL